MKISEYGKHICKLYLSHVQLMPSHKEPRKFDPTDTLLSHVAALSASIEDEMKKVEQLQRKPITRVEKPPEFFKDLVEEFDNTYLKQIFADPLLQRDIDPTQRSGPTLFVLQDGVCHFGSEGSAVIIALCKHGYLRTWIEDMASPPQTASEFLEWEKSDTVAYISGETRLRSIGAGKVAIAVIALKSTGPK